MKKIAIYFYTLCMLGGLASCDLDINQNPNYPDTAKSELLLPSAIAWTSAAVGGNYQLIGSVWSQHYAQNNSSNQYKDIDFYNLTAGSYTTNWTMLFAGSNEDLKRIVDQSGENGQWNYWMVAKVMLAFNYHLLVDFYSSVPVTEALQGADVPAPTFEDGKTVNSQILGLLDEAIAKKAEAASVTSIGNKDYVFNGDINNWVKFAKTLKLKILMRDFSANQAAIQALLTENDLLTTNAAVSVFVDKENNSNPLFEYDRRKLNTQNNLRGSATLVSYLVTNNDPRISVFYEEAKLMQDGVTPAPAGFYNGMPQGGADALLTSQFPSDYSSRARLAPTDAVYFTSLAECYFLQAEAYARLSNTANAKAAYDKAVQAAFDRWNVGSASSFLAAGGAYEFNPSSLDAMLTCILTQKWVAATRSQAWDSFFDICRTGIPALGTKYTTDAGYVSGQLTPSMGSVLLAGQFPHRLIYPTTSSNYNPNTPKIIPIYEKMWWHK